MTIRRSTSSPSPPKGDSLTSSLGGHDRLLKKILAEFYRLFAAGGELVHVADAATAAAFPENTVLRELGVEISELSKMPGVVIFQRDRNRLFLVQAVSSHGPIDADRQMELRGLFSGSSAGLIFVTASQDRASMARHLPAISWGTEVWIAETPTHLIHFDGERFPGPYHRQTNGAPTHSRNQL